MPRQGAPNMVHNRPVRCVLGHRSFQGDVPTLSGKGEFCTVQTETQQQFDDTGKVVLTDYYNQPDPRAYFNNLREFDYRIAGEAQPVFRETLKALRATRDIEDVKTVDLGCSYGINAALMKCDINLGDLNAHYGTEKIADWDRAQILERDVVYFRERCHELRVETVGIDPAENAVEYGVDAGLLSSGIIKDLEEQKLSADDVRLVQDADLVMSTGCIGYITEKSVKEILEATEKQRPWMAHSVLRMFSFEPYEEMLRERGYVTQQLDGTLLQRRFANDEERANVMENLKELGIDPAGKESEGWYHANFYLSRPADEAGKPLPISL